MACNEPPTMLELLRCKASSRKMRLYACACCRLVWHLFPHERYHRAIETAERYADGLATRQELTSSKKGIHYESIEKDDSLTTHLKGAILKTTQVRERDIVHYASQQIGAALTFEHNPSLSRSELDPLFWDQRRGAAWPKALSYGMPTLAHVFRDVFGNPFRPAAIDQSWVSSTVTALAQAIYEDRAFDRLPILADALEDAGCTDTDILAHCRAGGKHARGCWVVDLLLNRE